jgi:microcompartment protein CcmK/EutM
MAATPSPNYSDKQLLSADPVFQNRVRQALLTACTSIKNEAVTTAFHRERETFLIGVINSPETFKVLFANTVANDALVIGDATVGGTVALTSGNAATQAVLVTDPHIDAAIAASFNSFFRTPST